ncbi:Rpn family recombination-promoting nuclease/putative transposase [Caldifermentibacillus hisashii]|uniref:Rpn family recombination-promoting nuclease/putative transposase n=1 Tax=Caldifermentibacillus hisashii TaxID=996558 RepID=UPI000BA376AC|nr:Rpn family recombination-promoting nuclease/putative transposase [Caldifermentibacillus hisashii]PAC35481.1 transposase [Caldifermentibacillus hisashii]
MLIYLNSVNQEFKDYFSDLVFRVVISGKEGYISFLFEHKSYPDKAIAIQLLKYMAEIWEMKMKKEEVSELPIVIPLVVYHGKSKWRFPLHLGGFLNGFEEMPQNVKEYLPNFHYLLYDLSDYSDEEIKGNAQLRIMLKLLRDVFTKSTEEFLRSFYEASHALQEIEDKQKGIEFFEITLRYVFNDVRDLTKKDMEQIVQQIETTFPEGSEVAMTLADILREEGMQEGLQKGRQEGVQALSKIALQQLTDKYGTLPEDLKENIRQADLATLETILQNIFKYQNIDEVKKFFKH